MTNRPLDITPVDDRWTVRLSDFVDDQGRVDRLALLRRMLWCELMFGRVLVVLGTSGKGEGDEQQA